MALDNAQFISELSITDPPGTDAVAEGDDHIRTTKRATQQSFPNVDAAVPQTAAQMGQMAIKNEVNTFTQQNVFQQIVTHNAAVVVNDSNITLNRFTSGDLPIQFQRGGFTRWSLAMFEDGVGFDNDFVIQRRDAAGALLGNPFRITALDGQIVCSSGIATAPTYSFTSRRTMGMFAGSATVLSFATEGLTRLQLSDGVTEVLGPTFAMVRLRAQDAAVTEQSWRIINNNGTLEFLTETDGGGGVQAAISITRVGGAVQTISMNGVRIDLQPTNLRMPNLPTGPTAISGEIYAKQSQLFAGTELVLGMTP